MSSVDERRADLLDGAVGWVLRHGLTGLSLRPLAKDLQTSDRMVLYYFGTKERLVDAILTRANEQLTEQVLRSSDGRSPTPPSDLVELWSRLSDADVAPYLRLYFEVYGLALQQPDRYSHQLLSVHRSWLELTTGLLAGDPDPDRRIIRATTAVALVEGLLLDALVTGDHRRVGLAAQAALGSV